MKLRNLLDHIDEARTAGDLNDKSPVFAVVRNTAESLLSPQAWHAISIVDMVVESDLGAIELVVDDADDAVDISVASLVARAAALEADMLELPVVARTADGEAPIADAYADESGLGLMLWFEEYEDWLQSQT